MKSQEAALIIAIILIAFVTIFGFFGFGSMIGYGSSYGGMMNMIRGFYPAWRGAFIFTGIVWILTIIILILIALWLVKQLQGGKKK